MTGMSIHTLNLNSKKTFKIGFLKLVSHVFNNKLNILKRKR